MFRRGGFFSREGEKETEKENFARSINFDQRDRYRLITRHPVSKEPLVASRRSLINLEFAASGIYPPRFFDLLVQNGEWESTFSPSPLSTSPPHHHGGGRRESEREEERERLTSSHEDYRACTKRGCRKSGVRGWRGGASLEGAGWKENGIRARKLIGSIQCHRGPRDARFVRSSREGRKRFFSFLSPARHIPLSTFDSTGGVEYVDAYPKANVSQTRPPTHR